MRNKLFITLSALMLVTGALLFSLTAFAADNPESVSEDLTVDSVWLTGDTLHIEVTDKQTGTDQTLKIPLSEYAGNSEYVSVQAANLKGGMSNTIQFKNPFYTPGENQDKSALPEQSESSVPDGDNSSGYASAFTPDGTGTVTDNVTDKDGKEFFSVETPDGNTFYLIVDRQRNTENVYLLNAVTENDLASLAKPGDGISASIAPVQTPPAQTVPEEPLPVSGQTESGGGMNAGTVIFIVTAAAAAGCAGYYFKILRPRRLAANYTDDGDRCEDDDYDDNDYEEGGEDA
jgi:hypothetical protein